MRRTPLSFRPSDHEVWLVNTQLIHNFSCVVLINQADLALFTRNLIMLLLLINTDGQNDISSEVVIHLWYSAFLTPEMDEFMNDNLDHVLKELPETLDDLILYRGNCSIKLNYLTNVIDLMRALPPGEIFDLATARLERNKCMRADGLQGKQENGNGIQILMEVGHSMFCIRYSNLYTSLA